MMNNLFLILVFGFNNVLLTIGLSILYIIVESIRIYDARLIQMKTKGFYSKVAEEANGTLLPKWVGYIHLFGWLLLIMILISNWIFAIILYATLFILRVLPVLETFGAFLMRSFLIDSDSNTYGNNEEDELERKMSEKLDELSKVREKIESTTHKLAPQNSEENFVPSFVTWWQRLENQELNLVDALENYITEFDLLGDSKPDEPYKIKLCRAIIKIYEKNEISFEGEDNQKLLQYINGLRMQISTYELRENHKSK